MKKFSITIGYGAMQDVLHIRPESKDNVITYHVWYGSFHLMDIVNLGTNEDELQLSEDSKKKNIDVALFHAVRDAILKYVSSIKSSN